MWYDVDRIKMVFLNRIRRGIVIMEYISLSTQQTEAFAADFAKRISALEKGLVLAMTGDLGAGKTAFVRGLAKGLGYMGAVSSPTFAIINEYVGGKVPLYHFDMYRIDGWESLYSTGFFDYIETPCVMAVEWSENIVAALPEDRINIDIRRGKTDDERIINIECVGGIKLADIGD